jgi:hypothetical protein
VRRGKRGERGYRKECRARLDRLLYGYSRGEGFALNGEKWNASCQKVGWIERQLLDVSIITAGAHPGSP